MSIVREIQDQKDSIRQKIRKIRQDISPEQAKQAEENIAKNFASQISYTTASRVASYASFDGELSTRLVNEMLLKEKSIYYLPKLKPTPPNRLWFMPYTGSERLEKNRYGIQEVDLPIKNCVRLSSVHIILIPLVAFDNQGNRIGMGQGYYDASLEYLTQNNCVEKEHYTKPLFIGLAYEEQKVDEIPSQPHDIKLDMVLTQERSYEF